jgi:hypothetical protein
MTHAHPPGQPPQTPEEMTKDIATVENSEKAAKEEEELLKPNPEGVGQTLGGDLAEPHP